MCFFTVNRHRRTAGTVENAVRYSDVAIVDTIRGIIYRNSITRGKRSLVIISSRALTVNRTATYGKRTVGHINTCCALYITTVNRKRTTVMYYCGSVLVGWLNIRIWANLAYFNYWISRGCYNTALWIKCTALNSETCRIFSSSLKLEYAGKICSTVSIYFSRLIVGVRRLYRKRCARLDNKHIVTRCISTSRYHVNTVNYDSYVCGNLVLTVKRNIRVISTQAVVVPYNPNTVNAVAVQGSGKWNLPLLFSNFNRCFRFSGKWTNGKDRCNHNKRK